MGGCVPFCAQPGCIGRLLLAHVGACAGGRVLQLQHRRRRLRVVWAARALERRMSLRSGLALTEGRLLGDVSRMGVVIVSAPETVVAVGGSVG